MDHSRDVTHRTFRLGDRAIPFLPGDTLATALVAAGELVLSRSVKYRRARGPSCLVGDCGSCLARVDGVPNVRTCMAAARQGRQVEAQNALGSPAADPADLLGERVPAIDHHHMFVRPRLANRAMQKVARNLAGLGTLPDRSVPSSPPEDLSPDVLVVGAGRSGSALIRNLVRIGADVLALERRPRPVEPPDLPIRYETAVFGIYPREGIVAATAGTTGGLLRIRPRVLVLATGARHVLPAVPGNDLPGVLAAVPWYRALRATGRRPSGRIVYVGPPTPPPAAATALGAIVVDPADVLRIAGRRRVEAVVTASNVYPCDLVVYGGVRAPRHELPGQVGAALRFDGVGFAPHRTPDGTLAGVSAPFPVLACGGLVHPGAFWEREEDALGLAALATDHLAERSVP